jgi:formate-dependent nitrite reductase cytochrome c552 subunit
VVIRYTPSDATRQTIPWVEYTDAQGRATAYTAKDAKPAAIKNFPVREMDCMDCHNRPTHAFSLPDRAVDQALSTGDISASLPYIKKKAVELLKTPYPSNQAAASAIPAALAKYYRESYAEVYGGRRAEIERSAGAVVAIYNRNVFPAMKLNWGNYPNNVGHTDFPGCYRCHDGQHLSAKGSAVTQDCNSCHQLLAMDEAMPKILTDLGLGPAPAKQ